MKAISSHCLYDRDFYQWTRTTAHLLRAGRLDSIDLERVAEELEDMGKRDKLELESRMDVLVAHLLKWDYQPEKRSDSWTNTIEEQRRRIKRQLTTMPSLRAHLRATLPDIYEYGVRTAARQTRKHVDAFPAKCPYSLERILDTEPALP
ncbi:MAG: DUF29 domain-containing protein [Acidobacteriota bacterium]|nr:DUF29 domain-containing protein [Acidobacteriota bacterium]